MKIDGILKDKESLVQKIINKIKNALLEKDLKAGDKLPSEIDLARSFGVSRSAVREALKMLVALGVAESRQGDGTYIAKKISSTVVDPLIFSLIIEDRTPDELLELRKMIELGILEIVVDKVTEKDIQRMEKAIDELEENYRRGNTEPDTLAECDLKFHYAFAQASHNPSIEKVARTIWELYAASIKRSAQFERATVHHKRILLAIKEKDLGKAKKAINISLEVWKKHQEETSSSITPRQRRGGLFKHLLSP